MKWQGQMQKRMEKMMNDLEQLEVFLKWIKTSPFKFDITGMQGESIRVRFYIPQEEDDDSSSMGR